MTVRYLVEETHLLTGHGPAVVGLLTEGTISTGDTLQVAGTDARVRIRSVEIHAMETDEGLRVGLLLHREDAPSVMAGSVLVSPPGV